MVITLPRAVKKLRPFAVQWWQLPYCDVVTTLCCFSPSVLRDVFKTIPEDTVVATGDRAVLQCAPPKGDPPPAVRWKLNGRILDVSTNDRYITG